MSTSSELVQLAHKYRRGIDGRAENYQEAVRLYQMAAEQGNVDGQAWLAFSYITLYS